MKKARYICFEGTEGVGKTTQTQNLVDYLTKKGYRVLCTKEPGTHHSPLTMQLRKIMLDRQYDEHLTAPARELISQAIRSIHVEKVIKPALNNYDFIVQDRGQLSGFSYGSACGNDINTLRGLSSYIGVDTMMYDDVVYLKGNIRDGLNKATACKKEFVAGDAMEAKGVTFLNTVAYNMTEMSTWFNTVIVDVDGKNKEEVFSQILKKLRLEE